MSKLTQDLAHLEKVRGTQRKKRITSGIPLFCLVGYTNAGKSTILNALTKSQVLAENKLFSTLDTTTRELHLDNKKALISDTVGFIQQLPHHLVNAFKSTLSELEYANLLVQVVDVSDPNWQDHCFVVQSVLDELHIDKPMLYVFNKIDKVDFQSIKDQVPRYKPHVLVSALTPDGLTPLIDFLHNWLVDYYSSRHHSAY
jgi:GTP-binding protein HflX